MTVDPVITWLEQIRDFIGSTPQASAMAQRAIDRIRPPAPDVDGIIEGLLEDMGTWRQSMTGAVVSDRPINNPLIDTDDAGYYGGYLVGESMSRRVAIPVSFLPELLRAARENAVGRRVLEQLALALAEEPPVLRTAIRDRLDGTMQLARLGQAFFTGRSVYDEFDEIAAVGECLKQLAGALLTGRVAAARAEIEAMFKRTREERHAQRTGAAS